MHVPSPTLAKGPASFALPSSNIGSLTRCLKCLGFCSHLQKKALGSLVESGCSTEFRSLSSARGCSFESPLRCELWADKAGLLPVMEAAGGNLICRRCLQKQKSPVQTGQGGRHPTPRSRGPTLDKDTGSGPSCCLCHVPCGLRKKALWIPPGGKGGRLIVVNGVASKDSQESGGSPQR